MIADNLKNQIVGINAVHKNTIEKIANSGSILLQFIL